MLWLRQAQPPIISLHGAWACRRHVLTSHLGALACRRHILTSHLGALACRRHIISIALKIRAIYRTSLMFLWELKNAIISQNLRELCVIKANTNIPHTVASTSSATNYSITRCLSLSKAASKKHHNFITSSPRKIPHTVASTSSATIYSITRCLSVVEGTFSLLISVPEPVEGTLFLLH